MAMAGFKHDVLSLLPADHDAHLEEHSLGVRVSASNSPMSIEILCMFRSVRNVWNTYGIPAEQGWVRSTLPGMWEPTDVSFDVLRSPKHIQGVIPNV